MRRIGAGDQFDRLHVALFAKIQQGIGTMAVVLLLKVDRLGLAIPELHLGIVKLRAAVHL